MKNPDEEKKSQTSGLADLPGKKEETKPREYLRAVKAHLRDGKQKEAFRLLQQASVHFPDDPVVLSYFGCLQAVVDKKYRSGVETCKKAIAQLRQKESFEEEVLYPVFYLNLGRAFMAAGKKKDAIDSFNKGLKYDSSNGELRKELRKLGERKKAPVPFLDRSNPINKYIGMLLRVGQKAPEGGKRRGAVSRGK
jgi:tetratricopeptide (TPR) repeat protein